MPALSPEKRHHMQDTNCAMQLHVEGIHKFLKNGGPKQTQEIEISLNLMQKCLDDMKLTISETKPTGIVNS